MSNNNQNRFEVFIESETGWLKHLENGVIRDKSTGVLYFVTQVRGQGVGVTPLLDQTGKPIIDKD